MLAGTFGFPFFIVSMLAVEVEGVDTSCFPIKDEEEDDVNT